MSMDGSRLPFLKPHVRARHVHGVCDGFTKLSITDASRNCVRLCPFRPGQATVPMHMHVYCLKPPIDCDTPHWHARLELHAAASHSRMHPHPPIVAALRNESCINHAAVCMCTQCVMRIS